MDFDFIDLGIKLVMGCLGIVLYAVIRVKDHLKTFHLPTFVKDNKAYWYWSFALFLIVYLMVIVEPEFAGAIKTILGQDLEDSRTGWALFTFAVSAIANGGIKNGVGTKLK